ncbi:MAG: hypothetical protein H6737_26360 [Alphaproteobacteria bacterium]|nr:hypothetical protein [Alphaproteobacteria bacterium]
MIALISAAWALGLAVSPPYLVVDAAPGSAVGRTLAVRNTAPYPVEVRVYLEDWWYDEHGHVFAPVGTLERSAAVWSSIDPPTFRLAADERREIQLEAHIPPDASGGQYATVLFEASAGGSTTMRIASLLLIDAGGVGAPAVEVGSPAVNVEDGRLWLSLDAQQRGETHSFLRFKGVVRRKDGPVVARVDSGEMRFLPGQGRTLRAELETALEPGIYTVDGVVVGDNTAPVPVASTLFTVP